MILVRAPIEVLRLYAEDIGFLMKLDPEETEKLCATGIPSHDIAPIKINHDPQVSRYTPYEHIYVRYSTKVPESLYWRNPNSPYKHPFGVNQRLRLLATLMEMKPKWGGENLKMRRYIANGRILGYFPLHEPEEIRELSKVWLKWKVMPWNQPFHAIKGKLSMLIKLLQCFRIERMLFLLSSHVSLTCSHSLITHHLNFLSRLFRRENRAVFRVYGTLYPLVNRTCDPWINSSNLLFFLLPFIKNGV